MGTFKNKLNILVIDDDLTICHNIKKQLSLLGHSVYTKNRGDSGLTFFIQNANILDLAIIDIHLPIKNGLDICHEVRMCNIETPIIILTQETSSEIAVSAFDIGANDFMRKPFDINVLKARIESTLRYKKHISESIIKTKRLTIDLNRRSTVIRRKKINLRRKEFDLLVFFVRNKDKVLTRDQLLSSVWSFDDEPYQNTVDAHISILRKKLNDNPQQVIETIFGVGYRFRG